MWEGIVGWTLDVAQTTGDAAAEVQLQLGVRRSAALRLLALAIYGKMALVGIAALTIGGLTFLGARPPESTLTGALTGMVFALTPTLSGGRGSRMHHMRLPCLSDNVPLSCMAASGRVAGMDPIVTVTDTPHLIASPRSVANVP